MIDEDGAALKLPSPEQSPHLAASSRHLPGHLTDPLIRVPRRKSSHPRKDLMCRFFSSFPRRGREYASQRHVKWLAALLPYREIGGQRWRSDGRQPATCGFVSDLRNYLPFSAGSRTQQRRGPQSPTHNKKVGTLSGPDQAIYGRGGRI